MVTYCYRCRVCGAVTTSTSRTAPLHDCPGIFTRDYQSEGFGFTGMVQLKKQREEGTDGLSGRKAQRDLFLPTAEENRTPQDPTGQKYIRDWNERHGPRPGNKSPLYPETDKRFY